MKLFIFSFLVSNVMCSVYAMHPPKEVVQYEYEEINAERNNSTLKWQETKSTHVIPLGSINAIAFHIRVTGTFKIVTQENENFLNQLRLLVTAKNAHHNSLPRAKIENFGTVLNVSFEESEETLKILQDVDCSLILSLDAFKRSAISAHFKNGSYKKHPEKSDLKNLQ